MSDRLMTAEELVRVTGRRRYTKQAEWFKRQFGFDPPRSGNNAVVITWETFQGLQNQRAGLIAYTSPSCDPTPPVYPLRKRGEYER